MSNRRKRRIVARGVRRPHADIPRMTEATLQHYLAKREKDAQAVGSAVPSDRRQS